MDHAGGLCRRQTNQARCTDATDLGLPVDRYGEHQTSGGVGVVAQQVHPARSTSQHVHSAVLGSAQLQGRGETIQGVTVEGCPQRQVDLIGACLDVLADAVDHLLVTTGEHPRTHHLGQ